MAGYRRLNKWTKFGLDMKLFIWTMRCKIIMKRWGDR